MDGRDAPGHDGEGGDAPLVAEHPHDLAVAGRFEFSGRTRLVIAARVAAIQAVVCPRAPGGWLFTAWMAGTRPAMTARRAKRP